MSDPPELRLPENDQEALAELVLHFYDELRRRARVLMKGQEGHTLQPTAVVNEAFLKVEQGGGPWANRAHFLRTASRAMRQVLVDHFRRKNATTRPMAMADFELDELAAEFQDRAIDLLDLDEILRALEENEPEMAQMVDLRFFGGATTEEIAEALGMSARKVQRRWVATRSLLYEQLASE